MRHRIAAIHSCFSSSFLVDLNACSRADARKLYCEDWLVGHIYQHDVRKLAVKATATVPTTLAMAHSTALSNHHRPSG